MRGTFLGVGGLGGTMVRLYKWSCHWLYVEPILLLTTPLIKQDHAIPPIPRFSQEYFHAFSYNWYSLITTWICPTCRPKHVVVRTLIVTIIEVIQLCLTVCIAAVSSLLLYKTQRDDAHQYWLSFRYIIKTSPCQSVFKLITIFLFLSFRSVLNVICSFLGNSPASEF